MSVRFSRAIACGGAICCMMAFPGIASAGDFAEKQLWECSGRPGEVAQILINKVENDLKLGPVFHISISGPKLKNPRTATGVQDTFPHLPVARSTLEQSCAKLIGLAEVNPDYLEGYAQWRKAFDDGKAGVFTVPVGKIIEVVETVLNR